MPNNDYERMETLYYRRSLPDWDLKRLDKLNKEGKLDLGLNRIANDQKYKDELKKWFAKQNRDEILRQVGLTGRAVGEGLAQTAGVFVDPVSAGINALTPEDFPKITTVHSAVRSALNQIGTPIPETEKEELVQNIVQSIVGLGAETGIAKTAGKIATQIPEVATGALGIGRGNVAEIATELTADMPQQLASATGAAMGQDVMESLGYGMPGQLAGSILGSTASGIPMGGFKARIPVPGEEEAARWGITSSTTDMFPPRTAFGRWLQTVGEKTPLVGTGQLRAQQLDEQKQAIAKAADYFGHGDFEVLLPAIFDDLNKTNIRYVQRWDGIKTNIIRKLSNQPEILDKIKVNGEASIPSTKAPKRVRVDYPSVPMGNTLKAINDSFAFFARNTDIDQPTIKRIINRYESFKKAISDKDLAGIEFNRELLGADFKGELADIKSVAQTTLDKIYAAVNEDMGQYIGKYGDPGDRKRWKISNQQLKKNIDEIKYTGLKNVLNKGDFKNQVIENAIFSKDSKMVRRFYKTLSPDGKKNVRMAILSRALKKAGGEEFMLGDATAITKVSPSKFISEIKRLSQQIGGPNATSGYFNPRDKQMIKSLVSAIEFTKRASDAYLMPPTGVQTAIPVTAAALTALLGNVFKAMFASASIGLGSRIYESAFSKDILKRLPQMSYNEKLLGIDTIYNALTDTYNNYMQGDQE